jgi:nucleoside-diphosphate-sugar epimerase
VRVFLAGATGVIGRRLLPRLIEEGHEVTAMTRSPERAAALRDAGASAVVCDALDAEAVRAAVVGARPEVVVNHLTDLPQEFNPRKLKRAYAANDRIRAVGAPNLAEAAREAGARRMVAQSIAFVYAPEGGPVKDEGAPLQRDAPPPFDNAADAVVALEQATTGTGGIEGIALRFGFWYGPGTTYAPGKYTAEQVRKRRLPVIGSGEGMFSFSHVDDVAAATIAAFDRGSPGVYNVVDDEPAPMREWLPVYAEALGAKPPRRAPQWLVRLAAGKFVASMATEMRGASNAKARRELAWEPRYPSWRQGFREALG